MPWLFPALLLALGCADSVGGPDPDEPAGNAALGRPAFEAECGSCHASADGFDLRMFRYSDTTIIRRAVAHVDTATAHHIVAYIGTISAPRLPENARLFQPRGAPLSTDTDFAIGLFGQDAWPDTLTSAGLAALDPQRIPVALALPVWSDEGSNLDWMPEQPLPPAVLEWNGGQAAGAVAGYRAVPTAENLLRAVNALRTAERSAANPGAPCLLDDPARVRFRECFEVRRWTASLVALHLFRNGLPDLGGTIHDIWWDVGNVARRSRGVTDQAIPNAVPNWATWMYLGWSADPSRHASVYTGGGLRQLGLPRHATFVALRSQVARPVNALAPYSDAANAVRFAPPGWTVPVGRFALRQLVERLAAGDRPGPDQVAMAIEQLYYALEELGRKAPAAELPALATLGQDILARLSQ
jgi:hypothetical protein